MARRHAPLHPEAPGPIGGGRHVSHEGIVQIQAHGRAGRPHAGGEKGAVLSSLDRADDNRSGIRARGRGAALARHAGGLVRLDHGGEGLFGGLGGHRDRQGRSRLPGLRITAQLKQMVALAQGGRDQHEMAEHIGLALRQKAVALAQRHPGPGPRPTSDHRIAAGLHAHNVKAGLDGRRGRLGRRLRGGFGRRLRQRGTWRNRRPGIDDRRYSGRRRQGEAWGRCLGLPKAQFRRGRLNGAPGHEADRQNAGAGNSQQKYSRT